MALAKITITGTPAKEPQILENGDSVLLFKIEGTTGDSFYRVLVTSDVWKKATSRFKKFNHCIVTGKTKASANSKGIPFITVYCDALNVLNISIQDNQKVDDYNSISSFPVGTDEVIDISEIQIPSNMQEPTIAKDKALKYFLRNKCFKDAIRIKRETKRLTRGYGEYLVAKELGIEKVPVAYMSEHVKMIEEDYNMLYTDWFEGKKIVDINVKDIILTEEEHLNTVGFGFNINLKDVRGKGKIENPIAVRPISDGKYSVLTGVSRYFTAKILDIEKIPAVIQEATREEFVKSLQKKAKTDKLKSENTNDSKGPMEIELDLITVPEAFAKTRPRAEKIEESIAYYKNHGEFDKPIYTKGEKHLLIDGYKRYVAAKEMGLKTVSIINK